MNGKRDKGGNVKRCCANCKLYETCPTMKEIEKLVVGIGWDVINKDKWSLLEEKAFHQCNIREF